MAHKAIEEAYDISARVFRLGDQVKKLDKENEELKSQLRKVEAIYQDQLSSSVNLHRLSDKKTLTLAIYLTPEALEYGGMGTVEAVIHNARAKLIDACIRLR